MSQKPVYQRVMLKLSGEALMGQREFGLDNATLNAIAQDILQTEPNSVVATTRLATAWRLMGDDRYGSLYDYDAYVGAYQIETPPGWPDLASYLKDLAATLTDMHRFKAHPFDQSLRQGSQTSQNLMRSADPTLRAFFAAIDAPIREHMAKIAARPGTHGARNTGAYRLADSWSVFLRPGGYHVSHIHPQGWLSSAFYVEVPTQASDDPKAGWIEFGRPGQPTAPALAAEHALAPIPGRLVLFPSYMWHGTVPFASDERRISIAFDVVPD